MKHTLSVTALLVLTFIVAQLVGLVIINQYIDIEKSAELGVTVKNNDTYQRAGIQPPEVENESVSFIYILFAVLIGTVIVLLIIKFKKRKLWRMWFFLSVFICLMMAFSPFIFMLLLFVVPATIQPNNLTFIVTAILALALGWWKIFRPNMYVHNITEVFIYGGLAALLVPVLNIFAVFMLLIFISFYDMYAVWKSKHMVKIATFQTKTFAGLMIPYGKQKVQAPPPPDSSSLPVPEDNASKGRTAVLGGGDVAFPLFFSGVVMKTTGGYIAPLITTIFAAVALAFLLAKSEKGKFYPAMPFISAGSFVGYVIWLLIGL